MASLAEAYEIVAVIVGSVTIAVYGIRLLGSVVGLAARAHHRRPGNPESDWSKWM